MGLATAKDGNMSIYLPRQPLISHLGYEPRVCLCGSGGTVSENVRLRSGRPRNGGARINPRTQPVLQAGPDRSAQGGRRSPADRLRSAIGRRPGRRKEAGLMRAAEVRRWWPRFLGRVRREAGKEIPQAGFERGGSSSRRAWSGSIRKGGVHADRRCGRP